MKRLKKHATTGIIIAILVFSIIQLLRNKSESENELRVLQQYSVIAPVEVVKPRRTEIRNHMTENGILSSEAEVTIISETSGKVLSVTGNIGDKVQAGQILVTLEKELAESQYQLARVNMENAEKDLARYSRLVEGEAVTQQQLEAMRLRMNDARAQFITSKKQLASTKISSPVSGVIASRMVEKGAYLFPSEDLFTIVKQDKMLFTVNISEEDLPEKGREPEVEITIDAFPGERFQGKIRGIGTVPELSGRYKMEIELPNGDGRLRAGMSGSVLFTDSSGNEGVVIPRKCIVGSVRDGKVFIVRGDSVVTCQVKGRTFNETEFLVVDGINENDRIVLSGQLNLEEGSKIRIINP